MASPAFAESRAAFIVGNSHYENTRPLPNPTRDADLVASTLRALNFDVSLHHDLTRAGFAEALSDFLNENADVDVTFFYYAGHGIQFDGDNYLLGTDASLRSEFDIASETIALNDVVEVLERRSKAALVFVDACRDNPLARSFFQANFPQTRSVDTRGLAPMQSTFDGTMLVFAASPGQVAYDGDGSNSPFTLALARHLPAENVEVLSLMKRVIRDVRNLTGGLQNPTVTNDLSTDVYLRKAVAKKEAGPTPAERAAAEWQDFRDSQSADALEAYAKRHEGTAYAALARGRASRLREGLSSTGSIAPAPAILPDWCQEPKSVSAEAICRSPELVALDTRLAEIFANQLSVAKGATRGRALADQREWRLGRDTCDEDENCIKRSYELRILALGEFNGEVPSPTAIIRSVQAELNRIGCGAGVPDGVAGGQTTRAIAELAEVDSRISAEVDPAALETLQVLRNVPGGVCSVIHKLDKNPALFAGTWAIRATCPPNTTFANSELDYAMTLRVDGQDRYSGSFSRSDGWSGTVVARTAPNSVGAYIVWRDGSRSSLSLAPGEAPYELVGVDHYRCDVVVRKQ